MSDPKSHVALFVDFDALRRASTASESPPAALAAALLRYAAGAGRLTLARGYADWAKRPAEEARALDAVHVVPVLAVSGPAGEDRAHVRLAIDALEARFAGGEPDACVIATGDSTLLPLVQALRADGAHVAVVSPAAAPLDDLRAEADAAATVEDVLGGAVSAPVAPRPVADADGEAEEEAPAPARERRPAAPAPRGGPRGAGAAGGRDRPWTRGPLPSGPVDFGRYDWAPFVRLIDELEHRLPFVGVRYLVNKVLGPRNCGLDDPRQKRDLINRAVDDGLLEMYEVGNVEDRRDPVTACRLDRRNTVVASILGADTATPTVAEARADGEDDLDAVDAEGAPLEPSDADVADDGA